ncbi:hypothetical protein Tco_0039994 [Tanacetum coccineum]
MASIFGSNPKFFMSNLIIPSQRTIDQSTGGKLRDLNPKESWAILEDLALYGNESWKDPRDFVKPVKAIALPQDVPSTSDRRLIELENQVQYLMEAYLALTQPTQVNKITTPCYICNAPHDTRHCMENPEQAFVEYASSRTDEAGGNTAYDNDQEPEICCGTHPVSSARSYPTTDPQCSTQIHSSINTITIHPKQPEKSQVMTQPKQDWGNTNGGISNFTGRIKGMHVFVRNFTYVMDFMIVEDISSIIDQSLSQVADEVAYKMPHKIEQYDSLSDLEKEHTKSVYLRNEEDKRRGVEYVMSKILGIYKECAKNCGPDYLTGVE